MRQITFVTGNSGKVLSLNRHLKTNRYQIVQRSLDVPEIQAASASEIALAKARHAFNIIKRPLIVQDSSFHIHALNGFPGPYIKYINETIGVERLVKLLSNTDDTSCHLEMALVYIDSQSNKLFQHITKPGQVTRTVYKGKSQVSWSGLWNIYIPPGFDKVIASLNREDLEKLEMAEEQESEFSQFIYWLEGSSN